MRRLLISSAKLVTIRTIVVKSKRLGRAAKLHHGGRESPEASGRLMDDAVRGWLGRKSRKLQKLPDNAIAMAAEITEW